MGKKVKKQTIVYVTAIAIIVIIIILLGGGMIHNENSSILGGLNWPHIFISAAIGFVIGLLVAKRKW